MSTALLSGVPMRLNPRRVSGSFEIRTNELQTIGGKVVQVYGTAYGPLRIEGSFGVGGREEQLRFLETIKSVTKHVASNNDAKPLSFQWPERGWNFQVYLSDYSSTDGGEKAVTLSEKIVAPTWALTLVIVHDGGLKKAAIDKYIARLSEGIGWKQTSYNGPLDQGTTLPGGTPTTTTTTTGDTGSGSSSGGGSGGGEVRTPTQDKPSKSGAF